MIDEDRLNEKPAKAVAGSVAKRFLELMFKILSVKILVGLGSATVLLILEVIPPAMWVACWAAVLGLRGVEKYFAQRNNGTNNGANTAD